MLKAIVLPNIKIGYKYTHPRAIRDVDKLVYSSKQIWTNVALHQLLTSGAIAVNGCRQNEGSDSR